MNRIGVFINGLAGDESNWGQSDVDMMWDVFTDPAIGNCDKSKSERIYTTSNPFELLSKLDSLFGEFQDHHFVIYFSGHGKVSGGKLSLEFSEHGKTLPFDLILTLRKSHGINDCLIILDACYSGLATIKSGEIIPSLDDTTPDGFAIIASSGPRELSSRYEEQDGSLFTKLMYKGLKSGLGKKTKNGKVYYRDFSAFFKEELKNPDFQEYEQNPQYFLEGSREEVWIARNINGSLLLESPQDPQGIEDIDQLRLLAENEKDRNEAKLQVEVDDIDWELVEKMVERLHPGKIELVKSRKLASLSSIHLLARMGSQNHWEMSRAAITCFLGHPHSIYPQLLSKFTHIGENGDLIFTESVSGPIFRQFEVIHKYLYDPSRQKLVLQDSFDDGLERKTKEIWEIDKRVFREALINAFAHRDYNSLNTIQVELTPDYLEIRNPGRFNPIPFSTYMREKTPSHPRNPRILLFLVGLRIMEQISVGAQVFRRYRAKFGVDSITYQLLEGEISAIRIKRIDRTSQNEGGRKDSAKKEINVIAKVLEIPGNIEAINELKSQVKSPQRVIPFVGAGISVLYGFPSPAQFLLELANAWGIKHKVEPLIGNQDLESAAELLLDVMGQREYNLEISRKYGNRHMSNFENKGGLQFLPKLTTGPVITSNYDQVLEYAFEKANRPFEEIVYNFADHKALVPGQSILIKTNGDSNDKKGRIFSKSDYESAYGATNASKENMPPLPRLLFSLMRDTPFLFLGHSLGYDRIGQLVKKALPIQSHGGHFAILPYPEKEGIVREKMVLSKLGITPIWFPKDEYQSIGDILFYLSQDLGDDHQSQLKNTVHITSIPKINFIEDLIGRSGDLQRLGETISDSSNVLVLNGMGGIGKTTLAKAYIEEFGRNYKHIVWIEQRGEALIEAFTENVELTENLEIEYFSKESGAKRLRRILKALRSLDGPNLLVLDNVVAENHKDPVLSQFPLNPSWSILLTSRRQYNRFSSFALDRLNPEDAKKLFLKHYPGLENDDELEVLLKMMEYHTLTIEITAKTLREQLGSISIGDFIQKLKAKKLNSNDLQFPVWVSHGDNKGWADNEGRVEIYSHLLKTFDLSSLSGSQIVVLQQLSTLPPEPYSYHRLKEWLLGEKDNVKLFTSDLSNLIRLGWLRESGLAKQFSLHRILSEIVRYQHTIDWNNAKILTKTLTNLLYSDPLKGNPADTFKWIRYGAFFLANIPDWNYQEINELRKNLALRYRDNGAFEKAVEKLEDALHSEIILKGEENPKAAVYKADLALVYKDLGDYVKATSLLEAALESDLEIFGPDHPTTAVSYSNLATVLQDLGDYAGAKTLLEKAMASAEKNFGSDHPTTAVSYSNLALVLKALGDYAGAKTLLEKAMASDEKNFGSDHPTTAVSYSNLATVLQDLGDYAGAKTLLEKAMASAEKNFGSDHPTTAVRYSNLAIVLKALGDYAGAKTLLEKAMASDEKNFGSDHPTTAVRYSNLATVLQDLGDYAGAKTLLEKAMASDEKNFGSDHPTTAVRYSNLALVLKALGDYAGAKTLLEKAMASDEKNFGSDHPTTAVRYSNLALVLKALGDYAGAKTLLEKAMASDEKNFGSDHPTTAVRYSNLATVLQDLGDYAGAKTLLEKAMASDEKNFGSDHPTTAVSYSNLALVLKALGDYAGAKTLLEKAMASDEKNFGSDHPTTAVRYSNLALVLKDLGDYAGAKTLLEKAMASDEKNFGSDHPTTAVSYSNLATVLQDLGDYAGAKTLLEKAMASAEKNFGSDHPTTAVSYSNLATVLQALGDYAGAKTLLEKAMASDEKNFGSDHPTTAVRYSNLATVLKALGDYAGAKTLLEKAMASDEKNFGSDHPTTAVRYSNLALVLKALGDYAGAKTLLEKAMASDEKNFGSDHPTTAVRYSNLATVLQDLGDYAGAKTLLEKAMASAEKNFGSDHPTTAVRYSNLATVLQDLGDYAGAKTLLEKAQKVFQNSLPSGHPYHKIIQGNLDSLNGND